MIKAIIFLALFLLTNPAYAQLADTPSPTMKGNLKHDGISPYSTNIKKPYLKWKIDTKGGIESAPAIGKDGTLYFSNHDGHFFAIKPNGELKWIFSRENERFSSSPTLNKDGTIYFISTTDLRKEWNNTFNDYDNFGIPTLYALTPEGKLKWEFVLGGLASGILYSPAIGDDGTIYAISGATKQAGITNDPKILRGDRFWAINPDGSEKWFFRTGDALYSSPVIGDDGTIYVGCADENFYALNPNGTEKWRFNVGEYTGGKHSFSSVPSIGPNGTIYVGSKDQNLYALNPDGTEKWRFKMLDKVEAAPSFGLDGTVYAGAYSPSEDPYLYAINPDTGKEIWKFKTGNGVYGAPAVDANGILFFGSEDQYFYSLNPDGTERWKYKLDGGIVVNPVIDSDGTVYIGSWDNHLYAIYGKRWKKAKTITMDQVKERGCDPTCTNPERCTVCDEFSSQEPVVIKDTFWDKLIHFFKSLFSGK
jgi:outer membrane protein assembly factor BamB